MESSRGRRACSRIHANAGHHDQGGAVVSASGSCPEVRGFESLPWFSFVPLVAAASEKAPARNRTAISGVKIQKDCHYPTGASVENARGQVREWRPEFDPLKQPALRVSSARDPAAPAVPPDRTVSSQLPWRKLPTKGRAHLESNQGPSDLQSDSLPTELYTLWHHMLSTHGRSATACNRSNPTHIEGHFCSRPLLAGRCTPPGRVSAAPDFCFSAELGRQPRTWLVAVGVVQLWRPPCRPHRTPSDTLAERLRRAAELD